MFFKTTIMLILFFYIIFICRKSIRQYGKFINPMIVCLIPFGLACLMTINYDGVTEEELEIGLMLLLMGMMAYTASFSLMAPLRFSLRKRARSDKGTRVKYNKKTVELLINVLCIMELISFLISLYIVLKISGSITAILVKSTWIRWQYLARSTPIVITMISLFLAVNAHVLVCLLPKAIQLQCRHAKLKLAFVVILMLLNSIVTMSKEAFFVDIIILIYAFSQYARDKETEWNMIKKSSIWILLLILILLFVMSIQRNYYAYRYTTVREMLKGTISIYITIPIMDFMLLLRTKEYMMGRLCFRPVFNILASLGIGTRQAVIQEAIENASNVFTSFGNMYRDFGVPGIFLLSIFFGLMLGSLYSVHTENRLSKITINSIIGMNMVFMFYDLQIIQTVYVITILYAIVLERIIEKYLYTTDPSKEETVIDMPRSKTQISKH
ncbi:MAG: oligosaccharide repeat unit polymerase [Lachnospiraceae bacterium]|nr:oligosaccharide repeat unit polymerase [Lachnospiraceae bacterium]